MLILVDGCNVDLRELMAQTVRALTSGMCRAAWNMSVCYIILSIIPPH